MMTTGNKLCEHRDVVKRGGASTGGSPGTSGPLSTHAAPACPEAQTPLSPKGLNSFCRDAGAQRLKAKALKRPKEIELPSAGQSPVHLEGTGAVGLEKRPQRSLVVSVGHAGHACLPVHWTPCSLLADPLNSGNWTSRKDYRDVSLLRSSTTPASSKGRTKLRETHRDRPISGAFTPVLEKMPFSPSQRKLECSMEGGNTTTVTEFVLLGLSNNPHIQAVLFVTFLVAYLLILTENLLMLLVISTDSHLHSPMYFFLSHLSFLDAFYSSIIVPKLLEHLLSKWKTVSLLECFTQISLVIFSGATETCLLSVMAYDRFQAVCHPLLYAVAMNRKVCTGLVGASWAIGMGTGLVNTILLAQHHFCGPNLVRSFACELPPVLLLACSDPSVSIASILTTMVILGLVTLVLLLGSYTRIIMTALRINSATGRSKIFSTCSSHFLVVTIFYASGLSRYMTPASGSVLEQVLSVQYSVVTPLLNPLIYSLKNQEVKAALRRMLTKKPRLSS
ncbi:olfactory receptor 8S1-like [Sus scrofa]|uniref:olfactory receptor 8S1-like n=1 Tax=Sus scrofa TaxID=9823 RepID=UPI000A2B7933|nr:olfactory receptor 8S1-like [Sus scrofa]